MALLVESEEYQELPLGSGAGRLSLSDLAKLTSSWRQLTGRSPTGFFDYGPDFVKPKNWAGVLGTSEVTLQVLPKGARALASEEQALLDRNIGDMLRMALDAGSVPLDTSAISAAGSRFDNALEALCDLVLLARRRRILRHYSERREPTRTYTGQVDWARQPLYAATHPGLFMTRGVELDEATAVNSFLKAALLLLRRRSAGRLVRRIDEVLAEFDAVPAIDDPWTALARIRFDSTPADYRQAVRLAQQLLDGEAGGLFAGSMTSRSEVVFMPDLFEAFVWRLVSSLAARYALVPSRKTPGRFLGAWASGPQQPRDAFEVETDAEVSRPGIDGPRVVIDAKWKWPNLRGASLGIVPADVYQMLAYGRRLGHERAILAFPTLATDKAVGDGPILLNLAGEGSPMDVALVFIPMLWHDIAEASAPLEAALSPVA